MPRASRLSEMHAPGAQALLAEPVGAGGRVAAGVAVGPPPQPERHDAASTIAPSATTPIRLATANLPAPPAAWQNCEASPLSGAGSLVPPGIHTAVCEEWPLLG